jgi:acyl-CoA thioester hydrolase
MERGRMRHLRLSGADQRTLFEETETEAPGFTVVVRYMSIVLLKPARMDDVFQVVTETAEVKGASVTLRPHVGRGVDIPIEASAPVTFGSGGRARPIPRSLRTAMQADKAAQGGS